MSDKIQGVTFWHNIDADESYENTGWAVMDAGINKKELGYTIIFEYKTKKEKEKKAYVSFTERALLDMLARVFALVRRISEVEEE